MTDNILILAKVLHVYGEGPSFYYNSCGQCYSKVVPHKVAGSSERKERYWCGKCAETHEVSQTQLRFKLRMRITDGSAICDVTVFGRQLEAFIGATASYLQVYQKWMQDNGIMEDILQRAVQYVFTDSCFLFGFKLPRCSRKSDTTPTLHDVINVCGTISDVTKFGADVTKYDFAGTQMSSYSQIIAWQMVPASAKHIVDNTVISIVKDLAHKKLRTKAALIGRDNKTESRHEPENNHDVSHESYHKCIMSDTASLRRKESSTNNFSSSGIELSSDTIRQSTMYNVGAEIKDPGARGSQCDSNTRSSYAMGEHIQRSTLHKQNAVQSGAEYASHEDLSLEKLRQNSSQATQIGELTFGIDSLCVTTNQIHHYVSASQNSTSHCRNYTSDCEKSTSIVSAVNVSCVILNVEANDKPTRGDFSSCYSLDEKAALITQQAQVNKKNESIPESTNAGNDCDDTIDVTSGSYKSEKGFPWSQNMNISSSIKNKNNNTSASLTERSALIDSDSFNDSSLLLVKAETFDEKAGQEKSVGDNEGKEKLEVHELATCPYSEDLDAFLDEKTDSNSRDVDGQVGLSCHAHTGDVRNAGKNTVGLLSASSSFNDSSLLLHCAKDISHTLNNTEGTDDRKLELLNVDFELETHEMVQQSCSTENRDFVDREQVDNTICPFSEDLSAFLNATKEIYEPQLNDTKADLLEFPRGDQAGRTGAHRPSAAQESVDDIEQQGTCVNNDAMTPGVTRNRTLESSVHCASRIERSGASMASDMPYSEDLDEFLRDVDEDSMNLRSAHESALIIDKPLKTGVLNTYHAKVESMQYTSSTRQDRNLGLVSLEKSQISYSRHSCTNNHQKENILEAQFLENPYSEDMFFDSERNNSPANSPSKSETIDNSMPVPQKSNEEHENYENHMHSEEMFSQEHITKENDQLSSVSNRLSDLRINEQDTAERVYNHQVEKDCTQTKDSIVHAFDSEPLFSDNDEEVESGQEHFSQTVCTPVVKCPSSLKCGLEKTPNRISLSTRNNKENQSFCRRISAKQKEKENIEPNTYRTPNSSTLSNASDDLFGDSLDELSVCEIQSKMCNESTHESLYLKPRMLNTIIATPSLKINLIQARNLENNIEMHKSGITSQKNSNSPAVFVKKSVHFSSSLLREKCINHVDHLMHTTPVSVSNVQRKRSILRQRNNDSRRFSAAQRKSRSLSKTSCDNMESPISHTTAKPHLQSTPLNESGASLFGSPDSFIITEKTLEIASRNHIEFTSSPCGVITNFDSDGSLFSNDSYHDSILEERHSQIVSKQSVSRTESLCSLDDSDIIPCTQDVCRIRSVINIK